MQHTDIYQYGLQFMQSAKVLLDSVTSHLFTKQQPMHMFIAFGSTASRPSELYSLAFPATTGEALTLSTAYCINVLHGLTCLQLHFAQPAAHHVTQPYRHDRSHCHADMSTMPSPARLLHCQRLYLTNSARLCLTNSVAEYVMLYHPLTQPRHSMQSRRQVPHLRRPWMTWLDAPYAHWS